MQASIEALRLAGVIMFVGLGIRTFARWRRGGGTAAGWAAGTFGLLATVSLAGRFLPDDRSRIEVWILKGLIAVLALFPYFLFRFHATFRPPSRRMEAVAAVLTGLVAGWSLLLPPLPAPEEARSPAMTAFVLALVVQWTVLFSVVGIRLWRAGRREAAVPRRRMRLLALATAGMNLAIVLSAFQPRAEVNPLALASHALSLLSATLFTLGLTPPRVLRVAWRHREAEALRRATSALMGATRASEVADHLIPHAAALVGARAAALVGTDGAILGAHGFRNGDARPAIDAALHGGSPDALRVPLRSATLLVWGSPYAPFFGREETEELVALGHLADLALERCERFEREREFIANAAHELRTPLTTVFGLSMTLDTHLDAMSPDQLDGSIKALVRQSTRARLLIDDLLDLARIDSGVARIETQPLELREAVDAAIAAAPPPQDVSLRVEVPGDLVGIGQRQALERILVNLLTNAYHHGGHAVQVLGNRTDGMAVLEVTDDGPGVPHDLIPDLFDPFTRTVDPERPGSGLGLAIVRRLVVALGGDIRFEQAEPHGARFLVRLRSAP